MKGKEKTPKDTFPRVLDPILHKFQFQDFRRSPTTLLESEHIRKHFVERRRQDVVRAEFLCQFLAQFLLQDWDIGASILQRHIDSEPTLLQQLA
jgi:hypothetical protein